MCTNARCSRRRAAGEKQNVQIILRKDDGRTDGRTATDVRRERTVLTNCACVRGGPGGIVRRVWAIVCTRGEPGESRTLMCRRRRREPGGGGGSESIYNIIIIVTAAEATMTFLIFFFFLAETRSPSPPTRELNSCYCNNDMRYDDLSFCYCYHNIDNYYYCYSAAWSRRRRGPPRLYSCRVLKILWYTRDSQMWRRRVGLIRGVARTCPTKCGQIVFNRSEQFVIVEDAQGTTVS